MYARVRHDRDYMGVQNSRHELPEFQDKFGAPYPYPAVVPQFPAPKGGDAAFRMTKPWWDYIASQNTTKAWLKIRRNNAGWINWARNKDWEQGETVPHDTEKMPIVENITTIGALVKIVEVYKGSARIEHIPVTVQPYSTPQSHPWLWTELSSIDPQGNIGYVEGLPIYIPRISHTDLWIPMEKLEVIDYEPEKLVRAHGIDLAKYQLDFTLPLNPPNPIDFVIQRISYGLREDERFKILKQAIEPVEIKGGYHYYSSAVPWKDQADFVLERADDKVMLWLDYEGHGTYNNLNARTAEEARKIIQYWSEHFAGKVGLYTNPNHYIVHLDPHGDWMVNWPLWIAQYWWLPSPNKNPGWRLGTKKMNRPEGMWDFYQYSADGNNKGSAYGVLSPSVDLDVFNGTVEELREWVRMPPTSDTDEPEWPVNPEDYLLYNDGWNDALNAGKEALENIKK